ncbi:hypothetical protein SSCG_05148 [Streptomyces clavuligerus]|nr:hypothetical protein SSCG_05148 [Streptomyces clavuligerus]
MMDGVMATGAHKAAATRVPLAYHSAIAQVSVGSPEGGRGMERNIPCRVMKNP